MRVMVGLLVCGLLAVAHTGYAQKKSKGAKKSPYEEVDLEQMFKRYFGKQPSASHHIEGIYSVSCVITKRGHHFLTGADRYRVVERKDNYARVAILRDWPDSRRDFIEVSMSYHITTKYPIVGEFEILGDHNGYIYTHTEPDGSKLTFSMIYDHSDLLEGEYSRTHKRKVITYRLSYLKIYPKQHELNVQR